MGIGGSGYFLDDYTYFTVITMITMINSLHPAKIGERSAYHPSSKLIHHFLRLATNVGPFDGVSLVFL